MSRTESAHEGLTRHICWEAFAGKRLRRQIEADVRSFASSWEERMDLKGCIFRAIAHELRGCHFRKETDGGISAPRLWDFNTIEQPAVHTVKKHHADRSVMEVIAPENVSPFLCLAWT